MPEGHTIHRLAREHRRRFRGHELAVSSPQGRFAEGAALLDGRRLQSTDAYGKHLFLGFGPGRVLHVHLGLIGGFAFGSLPAPPPRGALRLRLEGAGSYADLRGPMACEVWTEADRRRLVRRLGPDPLRRSPDPDRAYARVRASRVAVGQLLMDQSVVAGVGNVFRAEVLFRAGISPHRPGHELPADEWSAMWGDLVVLMRAGLRAGRIVTTRAEHRDRGGRVRAEDAHYVYRRTGLPCRLCGTPVATAVLAGRNLYWCPTCQAT